MPPSFDLPVVLLSHRGPVTFGEDDVYEQSDAAGFIRLYGLPARVRALKDQELADRAQVEAVTAPANALTEEAAPSALVGA